jgi:beta-fructofuranosidase
MGKISRRSFVWRAGCATAAAVFSGPTELFAARNALATRLAADRLRPQYHLLPAANWMNDPNGPILYRGRYHMFYQYNPNGAFWGTMHWGHASSPDMIHWQHEPVALAPTASGYDRDGVLSGSVVEEGGSAAAIYTGVLPPESPAQVTLDDGRHRWREVQCLAIAKDADLRKWETHPEPILARPPEHFAVTGFRDPCVWREGREWLMALGSGVKGKGGAVLLYQSHDLRRWTYRHLLVEGQGTGAATVNPVDNGEMWECPDFFPLGNQHVLLYSTMGKVWWKTGTYHQRRFIPENQGVVDFGAYYAARTMLDERGNRVLWGWIPETRPQAEYRAAGWAGVMALPRVLSLDTDGTLRMAPAGALESLRRDAGREGLIRGLSGEAQVQFRAGVTFRLRLRSQKGERFAEISYDPEQKDTELRVNGVAGALTTTEPVTLRVFVDGSVVEVFANDRVTITARVYTVPTAPLLVDALDADGVKSLQVWGMRAISPDRLTEAADGGKNLSRGGKGAKRAKPL